MCPAAVEVDDVRRDDVDAVDDIGDGGIAAW